jgi:hypothetical protein
MFDTLINYSGLINCNSNNMKNYINDFSQDSKGSRAIIAATIETTNDTQNDTCGIIFKSFKINVLSLN